MKLTLAAFTALSAFLAGRVVAQSAQPQIDTPASIVQCQPVALTFSGGTAPYFLSILPGGQTGAAPIQQFPQQAAAGSLTWTANIPAGTSISFSIRDGTGLLNYSQAVTIQAGDSSCLGSSASVSGSAAAAPSVTSSGSASSAASSRAASATSSGAARVSSASSSLSSVSASLRSSLSSRASSLSSSVASLTSSAAMAASSSTSTMTMPVMSSATTSSTATTSTSSTTAPSSSSSSMMTAPATTSNTGGAGKNMAVTGLSVVVAGVAAIAMSFAA